MSRPSRPARPACGARVSTPPGHIRPRSFKPRESRPKQRRPAFVEPRSFSDPVQHVISQPAYSSAVEALLSGESTEQHQAEQHPPRSAGQARHVVSAQESLPGREALVHPLGQRDAIRGRGRSGALFGGKIFRAHKRPSTCGSGRLGLSCHVWCNDGRVLQASSREVSLKIQRNCHRTARLRSTWRRRPTGSAWSTSAMAMNSGTFTWRW